MKKQTIDDATRREMDAECSRLTARLGLVLERKRTLDRWVLRLRRGKDLRPVWNRRGVNADTLLTDMLRWLQKRASKEGIE